MHAALCAAAAAFVPSISSIGLVQTGEAGVAHNQKCSPAQRGQQPTHSSTAWPAQHKEQPTHLLAAQAKLLRNVVQHELGGLAHHGGLPLGGACTQGWRGVWIVAFWQEVHAVRFGRVVRKEGKAVACSCGRGLMLTASLKIPRPPAQACPSCLAPYTQHRCCLLPLPAADP